MDQTEATQIQRPGASVRQSNDAKGRESKQPSLAAVEHIRTDNGVDFGDAD
jgi:hypothetical protein